MTIKEMVRICLRDDEKCRNNDEELFCYLLMRFYRNSLVESRADGLAIPLRLLKYLPAETDIARWRQKFQANGEFLATDPEVIKKRQQKEEKFRSELGYNPELRKV